MIITDNILKCRKCGEYPQISAYRDGIDGYIACISCQCNIVRSHADIIRWAMDKSAFQWNNQNGGIEQ